MRNARQAPALKVTMAIATCIQVFVFSAVVMGQRVNPHGIPPPPRNTPDYPERESERANSRRLRRVSVGAPDRRLVLLQIKKDFQELLLRNEELGQQVTSNRAFDYKHVSDTASRIKSLAGRLDSNLALGKPENKEPIPEFEFSDAGLPSSLVSLHGRIVSFVENPVFREAGVFDIRETSRAKADVDAIIVLGGQIKRIAKKLKDANR